jgi:hypothetical protein
MKILLSNITFYIVFVFTSISVFAQMEKPKEMDTSKHYFSLGFNPFLTKSTVSNIVGNIDEVRSWATQGLVGDIAYAYFSKKRIYQFSIGHGFYREGFYYNFENIDHPHFPSDMISQGFEKSFPTQYSSFKFLVTNNFKNRDSQLKISCGVDFRMNWGITILNSGDRNDYSFKVSQNILENPDTEGPIVFYQWNSTLKNNFTVNPIVDVSYVFNLKNKSFLTAGVVYSIPFMKVVQSNILFYPDYESLNSSFNLNYRGGVFGNKN